MNNVAEKNMGWLAKHSFKYGFFGHTHHQGLFTKDYARRLKLKVIRRYTCPVESDPCRNSDMELNNWQPVCIKPDNNWQPLSEYREFTIFNPGSVGQPRQHEVLNQAGVEKDYRAAYMLLCLNEKGKGKIQFRRVSYQVEQTINLLRTQVKWPKDFEYPLKACEKEINSVSTKPIEKRLRSLVKTKLIPTLQNGYSSRATEALPNFNLQKEG